MTGRTVEVREFLANRGSATSSEIAARFSIPIETVSALMRRMEGYCAVKRLATGKHGPGGHGGLWALRCHKMRDF